MTRKAFNELLAQEPAEAPLIYRDVITTLSHRLRDARCELRVIYEVSRIIGSIHSVAELGDHTLDQLIKDIAPGTGMMAHGRSIGRGHGGVGAQSSSRPGQRVQPAAQVVPGRRDALQAGIFNRPGHEPATHPLWCDAGRRAEERPAGGAMVLKDQLLGFLALGQRGDQRFTISHVHLMSTVANQVAVSFAHAVHFHNQAAQERKGRFLYGKQ